MQKVIFAFAIFAVVTLYAISRGGDVDISSEAKGGVSYSNDAASAPSASVAASAPPAASGEISSTLAKH
ncbi:MAG: hypothetical protein RLZZ584_1098 [Pseudomonadota bacterium]|jgi:hypothetical protein